MREKGWDKQNLNENAFGSGGDSLAFSLAQIASFVTKLFLSRKITPVGIENRSTSGNSSFLIVKYAVFWFCSHLVSGPPQPGPAHGTVKVTTTNPVPTSITSTLQ